LIHKERKLVEFNGNGNNNKSYRHKKGFLARKISSFYQYGTSVEREDARRVKQGGKVCCCFLWFFINFAVI